MNEKTPLPPRAHFSIWYILAAVLIMLILQTYTQAPKEQVIPYSQFKERIAKGQVKEVTIGPQIITGSYKATTDNTDNKDKTKAIQR